MEKVQKFKTAAANNRQQDDSNELQEMLLVPWRVCKLVWNWIVDICRKCWRWLRNLDVSGMVNLTLLIIITVLFISLIVNLVHGRKNKVVKVADSEPMIGAVQTENDDAIDVDFDNVDNIDSMDSNVENVTVANNVSVTDDNFEYVEDTQKIIENHDYEIVLPMKKNESTGITPQIKVVGVEKPVIVEEVSVPSADLPEQKLYGDVIVDSQYKSPVLSNGVNVDGNLFIQNMRKYTLPCDANISGNLFIRNVERLRFCGKFTVKGNIYVNRQSSFGPIPQDAHVGGQVIL